jgi:cobalt-precorrin 5A hydrolase/precorrin-3B C17-methyltransferase
MTVLSVSVTERGRALAGRLPFEHHHGGAAAIVAERWAEVEGLVLFVAVGAAVRIVAPFLVDKHRDPAVVCVDEAGRYVVALCGGHGGGANDLAEAVARQLDAEAVITTATDAMGLAALDQLPGFVTRGDVAAVTTALLDGRGIRVDNPLGWPVPLTHDPAGRVTVRVTDERVGAQPGRAVLHPPSLVVGIGTSTDAPADDLARLIDDVLGDAGLAAESIDEVATIDRRATEPAIVALGHRVRAFAAAELATIAVPTPSEIVRAAVGTASVCEAAALRAAGAGAGAELVVTKRSSRTATVAIARRAGPRGRLSVVGLGPGDPIHRTPAAERAVRRAELVIGYRAYIDQCADLIGPGQVVVPSPIGDEMLRAKQALAEAGAGRQVALVCSGDAGTYAMASIVLELAGAAADVDVDVVPGIAAAVAAAAVLGAPLGHDAVAISLSDLLTSWDVIERRLRAAADSDLVVALYNPRSNGRTWQLPAAQQILLDRRPSSTPVGIVTDAGRPGQATTITTLGDLDATMVGMTTCVIIGATTTKVVNGRMVTPRGYR